MIANDYTTNTQNLTYYYVRPAPFFDYLTKQGSESGAKMLIEKLRSSRPFALIAGLNVIESYDALKRTAETLSSISEQNKIEFVFKASFDKANRSNEGAFRGPGIAQGLEYLSRLKQSMPRLPIVTDVHEPQQCALVAQAGLDMIQIPAFLCRQTDLIYAAADTGLPLLIKKGR
jgi:2-dehydro-3-deoxyphosphooctonate aldolase (KDO 8-P synthase)